MGSEQVALYEAPTLYDALVPPGPCEAFYSTFADRTGGPVLELACGTGRLSVPLAQRGHEVVALDRSAAMLGAARRKAEAAGVQIEFLQGDMRSFELGRAFGLVMVSCNSLSHLTRNEELLDALRRMASHLAPGGLLAFDIVNPRLADLAGLEASNLRPDICRSRSPGTAGEELLAYDAVRQVRVLQWRVAGGRNGTRRTEAIRLRTIFPQELPLLLTASGLDLMARFGDFDGNPLTEQSLNQVCIAGRESPRA